MELQAMACICVCVDGCACMGVGVSMQPTRYIHSSFFFPSVQPARNLQTFNVDKRRVSYTFSASPTSGATYRVTFTHQRAGIPQPRTETFSNAGFRTTSGLTPDVAYTLQVVAVLSGAESAAISKDFTTLPDGKTALLWQQSLQCDQQGFEDSAC